MERPTRDRGGPDKSMGSMRPINDMDLGTGRLPSGGGPMEEKTVASTM